MYELNDTIVAVSSPTSEQEVIVRITGPKTIDKVAQIFSPGIPKGKRGLIRGSVAVDDELRIDAKLYLFLAPHSYTGDDVAEIHIYTNPSVTGALMGSLLAKGLRMAGPGEFTARAYLNGKIDLSQAEAVNEIIVSSNKFQLAAAEKVLGGRLAETTAEVRERLMDCLSLIEAGLDFSGEDIEFITCDEAVERLVEIKEQLEQLLSGNISYESVIDLPAVGIAGAPNAGKSSLLNKLAGYERSIVSAQRKTTRDVLTGLLTLRHCRCVLFDCAGLTQETHNILDELAQQAAVESLRKALVVVFCVDVSKKARSEWSEDAVIRKLIYSSFVARRSSLESRVTGHESRVTGDGAQVIAVATKSDLLSEDVLSNRLGELGELFAPPLGGAGGGVDFLATSAETGTGIELLRETIDKRIIELTGGSAESAVSSRPSEERGSQSGVALTARHRQAVTEAIENISESVSELKAGNDEVTAMMLRAAYEGLSSIAQPRPCGRGGVDEQILERIFSRFCIGK